MIFVGQDAFACGSMESLSNTFDYLLFQEKPLGSNSGYSDTSVYLTGSAFYSIRVVFYNYIGGLSLDVIIKNPDGVEINQSLNFFHDTEDGENVADCTAKYEPTQTYDACAVETSDLQQGFDVNIYNFDASATTFLPPSFYTSDYRELSKAASTTRVTSELSLTASDTSIMTTWGMTFSNSGLIV